MSEQSDHYTGETEAPPRPRPRIWIGSLADYNAGRLLGDWVEAAVEDDELAAAARRILATSTEPVAEEWGIFDFDEFGDYHVDEHDSLSDVAAIARGIAQHGLAYASWADSCRGDSDRRDRFEEAFLGEFASREDYAEFILDGMEVEQAIAEAVPSWLRAYIAIDRAAFLRDLELEGGVEIADAGPAGIWAFDGRV